MLKRGALINRKCFHKRTTFKILVHWVPQQQSSFNLLYTQHLYAATHLSSGVCWAVLMPLQIDDCIHFCKYQSRNFLSLTELLSDPGGLDHSRYCMWIFSSHRIKNTQLQVLISQWSISRQNTFLQHLHLQPKLFQLVWMCYHRLWWYKYCCLMMKGPNYLVINVQNYWKIGDRCSKNVRFPQTLCM